MTFCCSLYAKFVFETYEKSLTARIKNREKTTLFTDKYVGAKMNGTKRKEVLPHTNYSTVSIPDHLSRQSVLSRVSI